MDIENVRVYCLSKPGTSESLPFDDTTLVFKVMNKMYCLLNMEPPFSINLKCEPGKAIELREQFEDVQPGYHMNKKHWNSVEVDGSVPENLLKQWIDESYNIVVSGLTKKLQKELGKI